MTHVATDAQAAAASFRQQQNLGNGPIADLITMLEGIASIHVAIEPQTDGDHHGMRASDLERGVTILGACATPHAVRLRSTLAHELGHHVFDDPTPANWSDKTYEEERATEFARHLLIPTEGIIEMLGRPGDARVTEAVLSRIVERFSVSPAMAAYQLHEAGFIDADTAKQFKDPALTTSALATRYGWAALYKQWSDAARAIRPPRRIVEAAISAYIGNDTSLANVANLRGATHEDTEAELEAAGIHPVAIDLDEAERETPDDGDEIDWSALDNVDALQARTEDNPQ